jgi:glycoside/pentoside/hexuronide:cation symporter, GPH family
MERLTRREIYSYGAGEVASNIAWNMATGFLLLYYTDVAMLPAIAVGTLMLVTRILDAVFDPLAGYCVDRTNSKFGRARPYLLYAGIPFAFFFAASFSIPDFENVGAKLVFAYVTFTLCGLAYSFCYVPFSAMLPMLTRDPDEKLKLGGSRAMGASIASVLAYGLAMPLIAWIGGPDRQLGFSVTAAIMGLATIALFWITFANTKERHVLPVETTKPLRESLGKLFRNPVWLTLFLLSLAMFSKIGVMVSSLAYFTKDVMGNPALVGTILSLMSVAIFTGGLIARALIVRFGFIATNVAVMLIQMALVLALSAFEQNDTGFAAIFIVSNVALGIGSASSFRLGADAVEWHERNFGHRDEGMTAAGVSFGMKVGMALGTATTAYTLGFAGYDPAQSGEQANSALRVLTYGAPLVFNSVIILLWLRLRRVQPDAAAGTA